MGKVLCITRKYPPKVGGMENYSYELFTGIKKIYTDTKIIALGKSQINLVWFFPYVILYTIIYGRKYDNIIIGDSLLCFLGNVIKYFAPRTKRILIVYGLDITYNNPLYQLYLKMFYRKSADEYLCISSATQETLKQYWGLESIIITPGINIKKFEGTLKNQKKFREENNIPEKDLILMTCGRLIKRKGVNWFINEVMPSLKEFVTYFVLGDGSEYDLIKRSVEEKGLGNKVRICGRVSDEFLNTCYVNSDVFVMPNIHVNKDMEGFGIVALEGSLAENIVIASGIEGIKDAIIDGKNGILVESENAQAFTDTISNIYNHKSLYIKKAYEYRKYTQEKYSWENICVQYVKLFKTNPEI